MGKFALAVAFALVLLPACAAQTLESFLSSTFEPGWQPSTTALYFTSGTYTLMLVDGQETFIFDHSTGSPISSQEALEQVLKEDIYAKANYAQVLANSQSLAQQVRDAKQQTEGQCLLYTGIAQHPCIDKDTCIVACSSAPICANGLLYSEGGWESLLAWSDEKKEFDAALSSFEQDIESIVAGAAAIDPKISRLDAMLASISAIGENPLFLNHTDFGCSNGTRRCFEFCEKINYSVELISSQRDALSTLKLSLALLPGQPARAAALLNRTLEAQYYVATRASKFYTLKINMAAETSALQKQYSQLPLTDAQLGVRISLLSNLSTQIAAQGDNGSLRIALSRSGEFSQQAAGIKSSLDLLSSSYNSLQKSANGLDAKLQKSRAIIGNETAAMFSRNLSIIQARLLAKPPSSEIAQLGSKIASLEASLDKEIVSSSIGQANQTPAPPLPPSQPEQAPPSSLPPASSGEACALPIGLIALITLFAFYSKP